ncbi:TIGR03986 family CRISPR-associated RAMP protein [Kamptonema sp. UHCC 0994]|uniref:TIGR03986 family type III CRISPR-associated RAMP protein n=1 Tax=Kamptonema sp. UHCC 0994 TaxID=3031329 RepID=UPI0023BA856D|nr:TIGR03986 family CRISPR-associated RAMP protein [Kamptonema sp. UHCC 0994]MDF0556441.1 TIGR03986 family CRISPR-associated RAMP protein [Kamptonema sp. UHCC 0994]
MNPRHLPQVKSDRKAVAPYNFVELPNKIVEAELQCNGKLRDNDRYYPDRHTGKIKCTLRTESPLYIRCGLTPTDFSNFSDKLNEYLTSEQRKTKAEFFQYPSNSYPVLPGSSLRGMLRTLVEIISFGKIEQVSDRKKFFFRAVAAENDDPLRDVYKARIGNMAKNVKAGYLEFDKKQNKWFIRPSNKIDDKLFIEVKEEDIKDDIPSLIILKKANYIPQYIQISFEVTPTSIQVSENLTKYSQNGQTGWLITSGNMLENMLEKTTEREREKLLGKKEGRKYHYIIAEVDRSVKRIEISSDAIRDYREALTNFQKGEEKQFKNNSKNRFDKKKGVIQEGLPIFYCDPEPVTLFGQSPNFRIPYSPNNDGRAASAVDFIPKHIGESDKIDLADAIFGFVRRRKDKKEELPSNEKKEKREQSRAGRIFVSDARYVTDEEGIWLKDNPNDTITPQILASSKPTTFQHYLVQKTDEKSDLKHYGSKTVIRGHKLYWHKGDVKTGIQTDASPEEIEKKRSQYTEIKPIKAGVTFEFSINFENLSNVELGALLWILTLASDNANQLKLLDLDGKEKYCLSLGMGKPLGMGAVTIEKSELILNERSQNKPQQRYTQLFDVNDDNWLTGDRPCSADEYKSCVEAFDCYIIERVDDSDLPEGCPDRKDLRLKDIPRIQMLLAMLSWNFPPVDETRYMEIERDINKGYRGKRVKQNEKTKDEYEDRLVLPTPLQIKGWEDTHRINNSPVSPSTRVTDSNSEGNNPNPLARPQKPKP